VEKREGKWIELPTPPIYDHPTGELWPSMGQGIRGGRKKQSATFTDQPLGFG